MSIAKIYTVEHARKPQGECGHCGVTIAVGDPYIHYTVGYRSRYKRVRCTAPSCYPKDSERESSKLSQVYSAQEDARATINGLDSPDSLIDDIESTMNDLADEVSAVAEEYREAAINPNTGATFNTDAEERADTLDSGADELRSWSCDYDQPERDEDDEDVTDEAWDEQLIEWMDDVKTSAIDAIDNMDMP